ncbi:MAG: response regulator [Phycisphaerales bacterium]|nr:response regulator [Phycisphaerales bacterium]
MSRILVVEDDPHILRVISLWLTREGHTVIEAANGLIGLELFQKERPDVLITDVNMPGMDGLELLRRVAATEVAPRGIVVLTNRWDHTEIAAELGQSGVHVMPKPFSPTKLSELIREIESVGTGAGQKDT